MANKSMCPQCVGGGMNEDHIHKAVTQYSAGAKQKPTKSAGLVTSAFHEIYANPPRTLKTSNSAGMQRKQMIAIALSKARAAGARIAKK